MIRSKRKDKLRARLLRRDGPVCHLCGGPLAARRDRTLDHRLPRSRGGSDALDNLALAHPECNQQKGGAHD